MITGSITVTRLCGPWLLNDLAFPYYVISIATRVIDNATNFGFGFVLPGVLSIRRLEHACSDVPRTRGGGHYEHFAARWYATWRSAGAAHLPSQRPYILAWLLYQRHAPRRPRASRQNTTSAASVLCLTGNTPYIGSKCNKPLVTFVCKTFHFLVTLLCCLAPTPLPAVFFSWHSHAFLLPRCLNR